MDNLHLHIQALLFAEGGALTYAQLARALSVSESDIRAGVAKLAQTLEGGGLVVIQSDTEVVLAVSPVSREIVMKQATAEFERDIGDAGLEVLAVLLYEGPSTRATIDYIRGVNSSSTIRTLLVRGLIERTGNPSDAREYVYRPTTDLLAHLGVTSRENLPEYGIISPELAAFKASQQTHGEQSGTGSDAAHT